MTYHELAKQFLELGRKYNTSDLKYHFNESQRGEALALLLLSDHKGHLSPSELSQKMKISSARVATILNSLEEKAYIIREIDMDDRRRICVSLTELGYKACTDYQKHLEANIVEMFELISLEEATLFVQIMSKLTKRMYDKMQERQKG